jgi:hypothetical protein
MIKSIRVFLGIVIGFTSLTIAAEKKDDTDQGSHSLSSEVETSYSYTGRSNMKQGSRSMGNMDSQHEGLRYVVSVPLNDSVNLRAGVDYGRFDFGTSAVQFIPNTLQSTALVLGADIDLSDSWLMRIEASPGLYSDFQDISVDDFNVPTIIGFSYLVDKNLQWVFGAQIDPRSEWPVMPGAGVRWKFADQWTLMFILPKPRIEYEVMDNLTLFAGGEVLTGGYTLSRNFGQRWGRTDMNNDYMEYREIRTGLGAEWKFMPGFKLTADAGWSLYRQFADHTSRITLHSSNGAPYGQVGVSASF